jgi:hypothetical protein
MTEPEPSDAERVAISLSQLLDELRVQSEGGTDRGGRVDGAQAAYERLRNEGLAGPI